MTDVRLLKAMVIGDGCLIREDGYANHRLVIHHSLKQKDYLLWKRDLLEASGLNCRYYEGVPKPHPVSRKVYPTCWIPSNVHPVLSILHDQLYPRTEGFRPGILDDLDAFHLALIFMDDGSKSVVCKKRYSHKEVNEVLDMTPFIMHFAFYLQSHGQGGCLQFKGWLGAKFGIEARLTRLKKGHIVVVSKNDAKARLRDLLLPHIHASMRYKLSGDFKSQVIRRDRLSERAPLGAMQQSGLAGSEPREGAPKSLPAGGS